MLQNDDVPAILQEEPEPDDSDPENTNHPFKAVAIQEYLARFSHPHWARLVLECLSITGHVLVGIMAKFNNEELLVSLSNLG